ncbi:acyl carrier protein [Streptomyces sp. G5(2025)]|uniref:acyl carrier protein n=1 Tax=Streptomyces sp. G5(2025) TaxID=3406628 RepID=UPI003C19CED4
MNDVYERFVGLLSGFGIETDEVRHDSTFSELEFDSLALVEISLALQNEFGVAVDDDELRAEDTMDQAVKVIEAKLVSA